MSNGLKAFLDLHGFTSDELDDIGYIADKCSNYNECWSDAECGLRAIAYSIEKKEISQKNDVN